MPSKTPRAKTERSAARSVCRASGDGTWAALLIRHQLRMRIVAKVCAILYPHVYGGFVNLRTRLAARCSRGRTRAPASLKRVLVQLFQTAQPGCRERLARTVIDGCRFADRISSGISDASLLSTAPSPPGTKADQFTGRPPASRRRCRRPAAARASGRAGPCPCRRRRRFAAAAGSGSGSEAPCRPERPPAAGSP